MLSLSVNQGFLLQTLINELERTTLTVDGVIGPKTLSKIVDMSPARRAMVTQFGGLVNVPVNEMIVSTATLFEYADEVGRFIGVPTSFLLSCVSYENYYYRDHFLIEVEGKFKGLGQFDRTTWESVSSANFEEAISPVTSLDAIARLYLANRIVFENQRIPGFEYTVDVAYLYHNQGASAAAEFLRGKEQVRYPLQSEGALAVFTRIKGQQKNEVSEDRSIS